MSETDDRKQKERYTDCLQKDSTPENSGDRELRKPRRREEDSLFPFDKYGHETERGQAVDDYMREMRDNDRV